MRTRSLLAVSLALALVACKSEKKQDSKKTEEPAAAKLDAGKPAPALDAGVAATIDAAPAAASDVITKPFLYRVSKDGKSAYFLGSVHVGVDPKRLPPVVWDAAKAAKTFAMETDATDQMKAATTMAMAMMRTDGTTLDAELGPEYWKKLEDALAKMPAGATAMLKGMKPAMPAAMIQMIDMPETPGIDMVFLQDAQASGKKLVFLEPLESQAKILADVFDARMLKWELDHLDVIKAQTDELLAAYVAGDDKVAGLDEASEEQMLEAGYTKEEIDRQMEVLLYERNAAWIPTLEQLVTEGDAFVVVGAAHLIGDRSVLDLLGKQGYTIERVAP